MTARTVRGKTGKFWGTINGEIYFTKRAKEHYCYKYGGYGIQKDLFDMLLKEGVQEIWINTEDKRLISKIEVWEKKGIVATLREEDGEQIFLPKNFMRDAQVIKDNRKLDEYL